MPEGTRHHILAKAAGHLSQLPSNFFNVTAGCVSVGRQLVTKTYSARLGTRITESAGARLRQRARVRRRRLSHVPVGVPGAALLTAGDLTARLGHLAGPGCEARHVGR
jgi:hypothetical protein